MIKEVLNVIQHTPTYVYLIFLYLIFIGIKATKDRVISVFKTLVLALVFFTLSIDTLLRAFPPNLFLFIVWLAGVSIGVFLGWVQIAQRKIKVDKKKKLLFIPGSWSAILIALFIFSLKYYIGYAKHQLPHLFDQRNFQVFVVFLSAFSSSLFVGRLANYLHRLKHDPQTDLP